MTFQLMFPGLVGLDFFQNYISEIIILLLSELYLKYFLGK